jgi:hypothetical protein
LGSFFQKRGKSKTEKQPRAKVRLDCPTMPQQVTVHVVLSRQRQHDITCLYYANDTTSRVAAFAVVRRAPAVFLDKFDASRFKAACKAWPCASLDVQT